MAPIKAIHHPRQEEVEDNFDYNVDICSYQDSVHSHQKSAFVTFSDHPIHPNLDQKMRRKSSAEDNHKLKGGSVRQQGTTRPNKGKDLRQIEARHSKECFEVTFCEPGNDHSHVSTFLEGEQTYDEDVEPSS